MSIKHHFHGCQKRRWYVLRLLSGAISNTRLYLFFRSKVVCLAQVTQSGQSLQVIPNLALKDSAGQSVLGVALWTENRLEIAEQLLGGGANVNDTDNEGRTLLLQAISRRDVDSALFLLRNQADANARQVFAVTHEVFALSVASFVILGSGSFIGQSN